MQNVYTFQHVELCLYTLEMIEYSAIAKNKDQRLKRQYYLIPFSIIVRPTQPQTSAFLASVNHISNFD